MKRLSLATLALVAMMVGLVAGPAFAQDAGDPAVPGDAELEGFTVLECAISIALVYEEEAPDFFEQELADFFAGPTGTVPEANEQPLVDVIAGVLADEGVTFAEVCGIYSAGVLPEVEEETDVDDEEEEATPGRVDPPTEVLGEVLSRTGADTTVLLLGGLGMFGLGFLALRRTRSTADQA